MIIKKIRDLVTLLTSILVLGFVLYAGFLCWNWYSSSLKPQVVTVGGILQAIKQEPKFMATTYIIDVALRGEKKDGIVPVPVPLLTWVDKGVVIFNTKVQVCYKLDLIKENDVEITADKISVKFPSPTFCDEKPAMDIVTIYSEGGTNQYKEIENYLGDLAKSYALVFAIQRGIFEDALKYDLTSFEATLSAISGKKVQLSVDTSELEKYKLEKEEELGRKLNEQAGIDVKLMTTAESVKYFDDLKIKFTPKVK